MSNFKKNSAILLIAELALIIICCVIYFTLTSDNGGRLHRVEINRVVHAAEEAGGDISSVKLSEYRTVKEIQPYPTEKNCNHDYCVEEINGVPYKICYIETRSVQYQWLFPVLCAVLWLATAAILLYIRAKILRPFTDMSEMTTELTKGNLSMPIKEEKGRFFGKFIWGMDMLRESLEDSKKRELEYQKERKTLILSLSHDIKTPLSAIELYTRALQSGLYETEGEKSEALAGIERNSKEIARYVAEITKASREDFLRLEVNNTELYINDVLSKIRVYYTEKLSLAHTEFNMDKCDNLLVKGDADRLTEVLQNVIENAVKYGDGKRVSVFFEREEDFLLITVSNTGNSLADDELGSIFDSFYRGGNSKNIPGSGLGLYICKHLMLKMGGDIFARTDGDIFSVTVVIQPA